MEDDIPAAKCPEISDSVSGAEAEPRAVVCPPGQAENRVKGKLWED